MPRRSSAWAEVVDELYDGSWNRSIGRFRSPYAFRGTSSENHTLSSSLLRLAAGHANVRRLEHALLRNFRKYAHGEVTRTDSIWDWLALGQHRGLPTRLLDWTYYTPNALRRIARTRDLKKGSRSDAGRSVRRPKRT